MRLGTVRITSSYIPHMDRSGSSHSCRLALLHLTLRGSNQQHARAGGCFLFAEKLSPRGFRYSAHLSTGLLHLCRQRQPFTHQPCATTSVHRSWSPTLPLNEQVKHPDSSGAPIRRPWATTVRVRTCAPIHRPYLYRPPRTRDPFWPTDLIFVQLFFIAATALRPCHPHRKTTCRTSTCRT
jgi:hypothetical protein